MNAPFLTDQRVDPRLAFLARAAARFQLVQAGTMDIDEAYDGLIVDLRCNCDCARVERWERDYPHRPQRRGRRNG
jgi:hypothetical protein